METREAQEAAFGQAWLEEQSALYQSLADDARRPSPVEFAARAVLPPDAALHGLDLRAKLTHRLRILDGLRRALLAAGGPKDLDGSGVEEFAPGVVFQDLEILERIGKGGMGQVFRARQLSVDRVVALKVPLWAASLDPREKARFWREAQAIARLKHPGIVPLYGVGERGGCPFLVLEHVEGRTLAQVIQELKRGTLPRTGATLGRPSVGYEQAVAQVACELLAALESAHAAGIVHRDVKPGNVMLEDSGRVRVLDFGLARLPRAEDLTGSHELVGTMDYVAPEVLEDPRKASPAADVYSVGILLYELLSGERPFGNLPLPALLVRILSTEPAPLRSRCRVPRELSAIVERAVARDPARRYHRAAECAADLEAFLHGREAARGRDGTPRRGAETSFPGSRERSRNSRAPFPGALRRPARWRPNAAVAVPAVAGALVLALLWNALARMERVEARVNRVEASVDWIGARDQPGFWRASAGMLAALGDFRGARAALTRALELAPEDPELLRELSGAFVAELAAHRARGEPAPEDLTAGAIALLEETLRREPDRPLDRSLVASLLDTPLSGELRHRLDALQVGSGRTAE